MTPAILLTEEIIPEEVIPIKRCYRCGYIADPYMGIETPDGALCEACVDKICNSASSISFTDYRRSEISRKHKKVGIVLTKSDKSTGYW